MKMKEMFPVLLFLVVCIAGAIGIYSVKKSQSSTLSGLVIVGKAPKFSFTNQYEKNITEKEFSGKVYIVQFFFTSCRTICPVTTTYLREVQRAFPDNSVGIASFSIDGVRDTPQVLKEYADLYGVTNPNWHFLTGEEGKIMDLANKGFNLYAHISSSEEAGFEHSGKFALIDEKGNIVSRKGENGKPIIYYDGTDIDSVFHMIEDIKKLQGE